MLLLLLFLIAPILTGATLGVRVKDPSGAVVAGATVEVAGRSLPTSLQVLTDGQGSARFDGLTAGSYRVSVTKEGFDRWEHSETAGEKPLELAVSLKISTVTTTVQVSGRRSPLANSDPNYNSLRKGRLTKVYRIENFVLKRDAGTFTFRSGSFSFLPPVLGQVAAGVFVGEGKFQLTPASDIAAGHLRRATGAGSVDEDFSAVVVYFSDATFDEIKQHSELVDESPEKHEEAFRRVKDVIESRREPPSPSFRGAQPMTMLERLLNYEDIPNYDAEILAELYNPAQRGSFRAFIHGKKRPDLRFIVNSRGAMPMLAAPEETALINFQPSSFDDGIWYLSHLSSELKSGRASSNEDKRSIAPQHYRMQILIGRENLIGSMPDLAVTCDLRFRSLADGTRMVKFDLVPDLQVSRVAWNGKDIPFVQESRKKDGSFYLQTPEPLVKGQSYDVTFEYAGGEVLQSVYGATPSRRAWYPAPYGAANRATYNLTFRIPHGSTLVTVGKPVKQTREGGYDLTEWTCDVPIKQAVFRYLDDASYKSALEESTNTRMSVYIRTSGRGPIGGSTGDILIDSGNSLRVFNAWYGKPAYDSLSVIVGTTTDSLPGLVYASPIVTAGYSSLVSQSLTRSGGRFSGPPPTLRTYLDEAFPREVSRQWWGNTVSPVSLHDEWLQTGLANFSTSLYDLEAYLKPDVFRDHWVKAREALLAPNRFGVKLNDAGPLWMGILNDTQKTAGAGYTLSTSKGGYVINMLRSMMWDSSTGDADFRALMQDFVKQFSNRTVSTEEFRWVVEEHIKPAMDLDKNHRMDWFFNEWVYGTEVPSYRLEYSLAPNKDGKMLLTGKLSQSGVSPAFQMPVPLFAEFAARKVRIGVLQMRGSSMREFKLLLPERPKHVLLNVNHDILTDKQEVQMLKE